MAIVNILISDQPDGLFIKLTSDEPMRRMTKTAAASPKTQALSA